MNSEFYKKKYIGLSKKNNNGETMTITDYHSSNDIRVTFDDGTTVIASVNNFKKGCIKNPNAAHVFGVGVVGDKYPIRENVRIIKEYSTWHAILERCYSEASKINRKNRRYERCSVDEKWLYYPNFYEWLHNQDNFDQWKSGGFAIDKDIIKKGNTVYSEEYCSLVPVYINCLFTKRESERGQYPIGVRQGQHGTFEARVADGEKKIRLVGFSSPEDAFNSYKDIKESIIKRHAEEEFSSGRISKRCYDAMMKYLVEITD